MELSRHSEWYRPRRFHPARWMRRMVAAVALVAVASAPAAFELAPATVSAAPDTLGAGGEYHPLAPVRIYDSRDG